MIKRTLSRTKAVMANPFGVGSSLRRAIRNVLVLLQAKRLAFSGDVAWTLRRTKIQAGLVAIVLCCCSLLSFAGNYASKSVLSEGKWVQIRVTQNAVYKLTNDDIKKMGFSDLSKIKVYGYGGWMLSENFSTPVIDDLPEVAVWRNSDFILFYGRGIVHWTYNATSDQFTHENNPYSLYGAYFITEKEDGIKTMPVQPSVSAATTVTTFDDYVVHERDSITLLHSGRDLFGESFASKREQNFSFAIPGIVNVPAKATLSFAAAPAQSTPVTMAIGDEKWTLSIAKPGDSYTKATLVERTFDWANSKSENTVVNVAYNASGASHLNYIRLNMQRSLQAYSTGYTCFRNKQSRNTTLNYQIANANANLLVWNVTDAQNIRQVQTTLTGTTLSFGATSEGTVAEYVLVNPSSSFPTPQVVGEVANQNLHSLPAQDMIIISPSAYLDLAEQLAEAHRVQDGLRVQVVQSEKIFNEFSSGTPDATAYRRLMKMLYDRATVDSDKPKYLLLYGDGHYNNRTINLKQYLLTFQFPNSLTETLSFGTDDYFGFLDDNEGVNYGRDVLDIGVGRFPVNTYEQATAALNKTLSYMRNNQPGPWKNTVIFTADDTGSAENYCLFPKEADDVAQKLAQNHPEYMVLKSYMDAFKPSDANGKRKYPDAKQKLMSTFKDGCFMFNYTGHGSPTSMSAEDMMNVADIRKMSFPQLPLWITATCDFGRFDDDITSAGEEVFLNKNSAGIALFTTTRVVYSSNNKQMDEQFVNHIFSKKDGKFPTLGDIIRDSKKALGSDTNKLNFILLGDPAMTLNYPKQTVVLESINDQPIPENGNLNFRALDEVTMRGKVVDGAGELLEDFSGKLQASVFDGVQQIPVLIANPDKDKNGNSLPNWTFSDYPSTVYKGTTAIENGKFRLYFKVPKDISQSTTAGSVNLYAAETDHPEHDAAGSFLRYTLFGVNPNVVLNDSAPEISPIFLNDISFRNGGNVNETPFFYAEVFDEDGINRMGGWHGITVCIDHNPRWEYPLDNYFESGDLYGSGTVKFSIPELPAGPHQLTFRVWDIMNNSATHDMSFNVVKGLQPEISAVTAYPTPARDYTIFNVTHNRPECQLTVEIQVFDLTGRSVWSHTENGSSDYQSPDSKSSYSVEWNLTNGAGNRVRPGIYIYRAIVQTADGKEGTKSKKIIVL